MQEVESALCGKNKTSFIPDSDMQSMDMISDSRLILIQEQQLYFG